MVDEEKLKDSNDKPGTLTMSTKNDMFPGRIGDPPGLDPAEVTNMTSCLSAGPHRHQRMQCHQRGCVRTEQVHHDQAPLAKVEPC